MARKAVGILLFALVGVGCGRVSRDGHSAGTAAGGSELAGEGPSAGDAPGGDLGGAGGDELGGAGGGVADQSSVDLTGAPIYTRAQRLTNRQWENAVSDILRFDKPHGLSATFSPPASGLSTFDNNERVLFVNPRAFADFEAGAEAAAAIATGSSESLASLYKGNDALGFVRQLGRRAFRRPLTLEEETKYQNLFALGERLYGAGFANGAALVIRGMLQSPHFLYRTELGAAGGELSPYELASKLSFWLLGTTPSDSLLDAADAGKLAGADQLVATAREMLEDPRAISVMRDFHGQLLHVAAFKDVAKNATVEYDPALNLELLQAANAFFDLIFAKNLGLRELLTSQQAYVTPGLAPFYDSKGTVKGLELRDVGPSRSGYFMQVPFLLSTSPDSVPIPSRRGFQLEATMLCVPTPPNPQVELPPPAERETNRQLVSEFTQGCGGACHSHIDALGFAFENFDGFGQKRELDRGLAIDTTGSYSFAEGVELFADGNELMQILARSAQTHTCYSKQVTGYALGRDVVESDRPLLESLGEVSRSHSLKELIIALVRDPAFRTRKDGLP